MAGKGIKGITIEIGGDTKGLDKALEGVNKQSKDLQGELKAVERGLKFDPGNVELIRQKQELLTASITQTSGKLDVLRTAQAQVQAQFNRGEIGVEQYRAFQRELQQTEGDMNRLQSQLGSLGTDQERLSQTTRQLGAFFEATGTDVEQFAGTLGSRLTQSIRDGSASADQMERALRLMGRQALGAGTDIDQMREELSRINNGGSIDEIRNAFQRMGGEVVSAQSELKEIDALLKFNPNSTELLAQKQTLLARSIQETSTTLEGLRQSQAQVEAQFASGNMGEEAYRAFRRELERTEQSLNGYQNQLNGLTQEQQQVQTSTRHLQTLFDATGTSVEQFADDIGIDLVRAIQEGRATSGQLEEAIRQIGTRALGADTDLDQLREALRNVDNGANIDEIRADLDRLRDSADEAEEEVGNLGETLNNAGEKMRSAGRELSMNLTLPLVALSGASVKTAMDFEAQMDRVGAIAGATADDMEAMTETALRLGSETSKSASEVALGFEEMAAMGFTANEIIGAMPGVIAAAEASGSDMAQTAEVMASTLNIFGLKAGEASKVADILAMTANVSAASLTDMQYALKYAGPPAAALGVSLEELSAGIGIMTNAGMKGEQAGTTLRGALLGLLDPSEANAELMTQLGFSMIDANGEFIGLSKLVEGLSKGMSHLSETNKAAMLSTLVGKEAVSGMLSLMAAGPATIDKMTKSLEESGGASAEAAAKMKDNLAGALDELGGTIETAAITIGTILTPTILKIGESIQGLVEKFQGLSPEGQKLILVLGAIAAAIGPLLIAIGFISSAIGTALTLFGTISGAIAVMTTGVASAVPAVTALAAVFTFLTGPIGIAIAAIAGTIAVMVLAYNKIEWFREGVQKVWGAIKQATVIAFDAIKQTISTVVGAVVAFVKTQLDKFKSFWDENGKQIMAIVKVAFEQIKGNIEFVMGIIKGIFEVVWPLISATVRYAWETIKLIVRTGIDLVLGIIQTVLKVLQGDWSGAWDAIWGTVKKIWGNIDSFLKGIDLAGTGRNIMEGLLKGIDSMADAIWKKVKSIVDGIKDAITGALGINSPSKVTTEYGVNVGQGLILGMDDMISKVAQSSSRLSDAVSNVYGSLGNSRSKSMAEMAIPQASLRNVRQTASTATTSPANVVNHNTIYLPEWIKDFEQMTQFFNKRSLNAYGLTK